MSRLQAYLDELIPKTEPVFRPTAAQGLLNPPPQAEAKPYSPETFSLLATQPTVAKQLGLLGLAFAPGAGFSDYAGTYPSAQGGTEPSAQQNWQQGNYITAGLQGLGAFGDAATLSAAALGPFAPLAAGVGMVAKAPRAAQRGVDGLIDTVRPKLDDLGFFSQVERSVMDIPQQKGTGQQFLAQIQKTPGVKPEELQYTGLDTFLANKPTVTKAEIQDYLDTNRVQVQEVTLGSPQALEARDSQIAQRYGYQAEFDNGQMSFYDTNLDDYVEFRDLPAAMRTELSNPQTEFGGATKFSQYTIPGGENYREVLLTLPKSGQNEFELVSKNADALKKQTADLMEQWKNLADVSAPGDPAVLEAYKKLADSRKLRDSAEAEVNAMRKKMSEQTFKSSHFDQPNILAHMRINDRTIDGKPTMFIEEVQSDWHQAGRKQGYQDQNIRSVSEIDKELDSVVNELRSMPGVGYAPTEQDWARFPEITARHEQLVAERSLASQPKTGVPDAPFKSTWDELSLKRAIKMASDEGYEQIAFTTGKTQADRYDLSKQVDKIVWNEQNGTFAAQRAGSDTGTIMHQNVTASNLSDYIGKEAAEKLIGAKSLSGWRTIEGEDLRVGGEGMKGFYDKMLPKKLEKIGKKYGAKPTKTTMQTPDGEVEVWTFSLPKEMRDTVKEQGQPLFQIGAGAAGLGTAGLLATEEEQY
jgi:hypothetical protein